METPCSIPNQEAKHIVGDDTTPYWQGESSSLRTCFFKKLYFPSSVRFLIIKVLFSLSLLKIELKLTSKTKNFNTTNRIKNFIRTIFHKVFPSVKFLKPSL